MLTLAVLLAASVAAAPAPDTADAREHLQPLAQTLELELDPQAVRVHGSFTARVRVRDAARHVRLDMAGPVPDRVELQDAAGRVNLIWGEDARGLLLEARRALVPGLATLFVSFSSAWADSGAGLVRTLSARDPRIVARFAAGGAHRAFPCWDDARATPWTLQLHVPRGWTVRSPLPREGLAELRGEWRTVVLRSRGAMSAGALQFEARRGE